MALLSTSVARFNANPASLSRRNQPAEPVGYTTVHPVSISSNFTHCCSSTEMSFKALRENTPLPPHPRRDLRR